MPHECRPFATEEKACRRDFERDFSLLSALLFSDRILDKSKLRERANYRPQSCFFAGDALSGTDLTVRLETNRTSIPLSQIREMCFNRQGILSSADNKTGSILFRHKVDKRKITMKYRFKFGRGNKVVLNDNKTFADLGFAILDIFGINPEHLFNFEFANGESTDSVTPFGTVVGGSGNVSILSKLKDRKMEIGETLVLVYDYSGNWEKRIKLDGFE